MKKLRFLPILVCLCLTSKAQETWEYEEGDTTYVMQKYFISLLMTGTEKSADEEEAARLQQAHLDHMSELAEQGIICMVGPFENGAEYRGVVIYATKTLEEAESFQKLDPLVQRNILTYKLIPWWAAKGSKLP